MDTPLQGLPLLCVLLLVRMQTLILMTGAQCINKIAVIVPIKTLHALLVTEMKTMPPIRAHVSMLKSHMLQQKSVEVLEFFVSTFPTKNGVVNAWKFEKAHSILHKVCDLILFGWSEDFSTQGPEHCHIDLVK
jgi:hypothetical protein